MSVAELAGAQFWLEAMVSLLLVFSGLLVLTGAVGILRLKDFFQRMHPTALASTLGTWCACAASIVFFSALQDRPVIRSWLIPILLAITVPITTLLLARATLFRRRSAGADVPAPLATAPLATAPLATAPLATGQSGKGRPDAGLAGKGQPDKGPG